MNNEEDKVWDVVICGAGLAGLTLARQMRLWAPEASVLLLDKFAGPIEPACHKVGESTEEIGARYFSEVLQLQSYFRENHFYKLGLRFYWGDGDVPIAQRPELGVTDFPDLFSLQIDRGLLEDDFRQACKGWGITLWEGQRIDDIELSDSGEAHTIHLQDEAQSQTVRCRWVVDAMGRRRFLQRKLGLEKPFGNKHASVWFRVEGRIDLTDRVSKDDKSWHDRVPAGNRYNSTNHMLHEKGWVWCIPLSSGHTSIGIVIDEAKEDFAAISSHERALQWLKEHEGELWQLLKDEPARDFGKMRNMSYSTKQAFSTQRWACVGESAAFTDPFMSNGSELISLGNSLTSELIRTDLQGGSIDAGIALANQILLSIAEGTTTGVQNSYRYFNNPLIAAANFSWAYHRGALGFVVFFSQLFRPGWMNPETMQSFIFSALSTFQKVEMIGEKMQEVFAHWEARSTSNHHFGYVDYLKLSGLAEIWRVDYDKTLTFEEFSQRLEWASRILEESTQAYFLLALEDVDPASRALIGDDQWLNTMAIGLDPEQWESDGLFSPEMPAAATANLAVMRKELRSKFLQQS